MKTQYIYIWLLLFTITFSSCYNRNLRGGIKKSNDGLTYLVIDKSNLCDSILIDNKKWDYPINEPGLIAPGNHKITCNGDLTIKIKKGTVFYFNYWGP